jgi:hypothetical protein
MRETFMSGLTRGEWVAPFAESPSLLIYWLFDVPINKRVDISRIQNRGLVRCAHNSATSSATCSCRGTVSVGNRWKRSPGQRSANWPSRGGFGKCAFVPEGIQLMPADKGAHPNTFLQMLGLMFF